MSFAVFQNILGFSTPLRFHCRVFKNSFSSHFLHQPIFSSFSMASWTCSNCTFLNQNTTNLCQVCNSSSNAAEWPCQTCTFLNKFGRSDCEMCGAMATATLSSLLVVEDDDEEEEATKNSVGTKFRPLQPCSQKEEEEVMDSTTNVKKRASSEEEEEGWVDMKKASKNSPSASASASASSITNSLLADLHNERVSRAANKDSVGAKSPTLENISKKATDVVFLTYNVWFREDLEVHGRMKALGDLIEQHQPHLICLQEVTPNIYEIFRHSSWWDKYKCSVSPQHAKMRAYFCIQLSRLLVVRYQRHPFRNSIMGRELCLADVETGNGKQLIIATSHLESPSPAPPKWDQMYSAERVFQANESFNLLKSLPNQNIIFGGDMNWDDRLDGEPPHPDNWYDVWVKLKPGQNGWTYDTKSNKMLTGNRSLQKRLDRIFCHLQDFDVESIDMIGTDPISGLSYTKEKKTRNQSQMLTLPVLPSDHYGLLLKLRSKK